MKYIGFGDVNKKLLYILLGGIGKLIAELILYFYGKDVKMTNHCFIRECYLHLFLISLLNIK